MVIHAFLSEDSPVFIKVVLLLPYIDGENYFNYWKEYITPSLFILIYSTVSTYLCTEPL